MTRRSPLTGLIVNPDILTKVYLFFGAANCQFKIQPETSAQQFVMHAVQGEDDGYRSSFDSLNLIPKSNVIFCDEALGRVIIREAHGYGTDFAGWQLIDADDKHLWLTFGTDCATDYYPQFTFDYSPKTT